MSKIEAKILAVTGTKRKKDEEDSDFRRRLVLVVMRRADDSKEGQKLWDDLTDDEIGDAAQNWCNAGIRAVNQAREDAKESGEKYDESAVEIDEYPDAEETESEDNEENQEMSETDTDTDTKKTRKSVKGNPGKKAAAKPGKKAVAEKEKPANKEAKKGNGTTKSERAPRKPSGGSGGYSVIRRAIVKNPQITTDELCILLEKKDMKISSLAVSTIRSASLQFLAILKEEGCLKNVNL